MDAEKGRTFPPTAALHCKAQHWTDIKIWALLISYFVIKKTAELIFQWWLSSRKQIIKDELWEQKQFRLNRNMRTGRISCSHLCSGILKSSDKLKAPGAICLAAFDNLSEREHFVLLGPNPKHRLSSTLTTTTTPFPKIKVSVHLAQSRREKLRKWLQSPGIFKVKTPWRIFSESLSSAAGEAFQQRWSEAAQHGGAAALCVSSLLTLTFSTSSICIF